MFVPNKYTLLYLLEKILDLIRTDHDQILNKLFQLFIFCLFAVIIFHNSLLKDFVEIKLQYVLNRFRF